MKRIMLPLLLLLSTSVIAAEVEFTMIRFFDPHPVVRQRVKDEVAMGDYLKKSQAAVRNKLESFKLPPSGGFLVLAIRADGRTNAWLDMVHPVSKDVQTAVVKTAKSIAPFGVKSGTLLVALDMSINGGVIPDNVSPYPQPWIDYATNCKACGELDAETIVNKIWL